MTTPERVERAPSARERVRAEITAEILEVARRHLAAGGAAALSLRAVTREVGMASSAVYRYFPSRDELLTQLIIDAYESVAVAAEVGDGSARRDDFVGRYAGAAIAVRAWAVANPHEYGLVYGTPVPGYAAPEATVVPVQRLSMVLIDILVEGVAAGVVATDDRIETSRAVRNDFAALRSAVAPGVPDGVISRGLMAWTHLFGSISFEVFGQLHRVITDHEGFFELQARRMAHFVVNGQ